MSSMPAACSWRISRSMSTSPFTFSRAFGFSYDRGAKRELMPAAIMTALSTRYGASAASPASVMRFVPSRQPMALSSLTIPFTVPSALPVPCAMARCESAGSPAGRAAM